MKNNGTYKLLIFALAFAAIICTMVSCKQDVIFYDIAQEIEYEAPIVEGNILSMVPCNGQLFVQNNNIYKKGWLDEKTSDARWRQLSVAPVSGKPVAMLASDENYLYALVKDNAAATKGDVYAAPVTSSGMGDWSRVGQNVLALFDNRVFNRSNGNTAGRNAYFTDENKAVKKLAGTGTAVDQSVTDVLGDTSEDAYIRTAGSDGTNDYFCSNSIFAVLNVSGTAYLYTFDKALSSSAGGKTMKYKVATASSFSDGGTTESIITTLTADGSDKLLVGTQGGYEVSTVGSDGKPGNGASPSNNAESAFGTRYVTGIWHYGADGTLYAAVVGVEHSTYNKLWGFYTLRNKWNYE